MITAEHYIINNKKRYSNNQESNIPIYLLIEYFEIYKEYIEDNKLDDDSEDLRARDLIYFVENVIFTNII